jgi:mRNA-degrading endonuclease RelE of RelBE toxin-antitoxin system
VELELRILPRAQKDLARLPYAGRERIKAYAVAPRDPRHDVVALVGTRAGYRLRVEDWRVIFAVLEGRMEVTLVMHRREAYR